MKSATVKSPVEEAWHSSYRMEVWMTGSTATALLFLQDHDLLVVGESNGIVRVLDETTRGPTSVVCGHEGASVAGLVALKSKKKCNLFVSLGSDGEVKLWHENPAKPRYFEFTSTCIKSAVSQNCGVTKNSVFPPKEFRPVILIARGGEVLLYSDGERVSELVVEEDDQGAVRLSRVLDIDLPPGGAAFIDADGDSIFAIDAAAGTLRAWAVDGGQPRFSAPRPDAADGAAARRGRAAEVAVMITADYDHGGHDHGGHDHGGHDHGGRDHGGHDHSGHDHGGHGHGDRRCDHGRHGHGGHDHGGHVLVSSKTPRPRAAAHDRDRATRLGRHTRGAYGV